MAELVVEESHGDPRHLETARRALADLGRLWNLPVAASEAAAEVPRETTFTLKLDIPPDPPPNIRARMALRELEREREREQ